MNQTEFNNKLAYLFDSLSKTVIDESNLDGEISKLTECEIKILFWMYTSQILSEALEHDLFDSIMKFIRKEIIFSSINESLFDEKFIENLINERSAFHSDGILELDTSSRYNNYFYHLSVLWFEKPFKSPFEIKESNLIYFKLDPFEEANAQVAISAFFSQLLPSYLKALEALIRILKR